MTTFTPISIVIDTFTPVYDGNGSLSDIEVNCTLTVRDESGNLVNIPGQRSSGFADGDPDQVQVGIALFNAVVHRVKGRYGIA